MNAIRPLATLHTITISLAISNHLSLTISILSSSYVSFFFVISFFTEIDDIHGATILSRCDFTSATTQRQILSILPPAGADVIMRYNSF